MDPMSRLNPPIYPRWYQLVRIHLGEGMRSLLKWISPDFSKKNGEKIETKVLFLLSIYICQNNFTSCCVGPASVSWSCLFKFEWGMEELEMYCVATISDWDWIFDTFFKWIIILKQYMALVCVHVYVCNVWSLIKSKP